MEKLRLAYFSPLTPQRSGIAEYSEELLPYLGELADVDVVVGGYQPTCEIIRKRFRVIQANEFARYASSYHVAIYQIGNSLDHHGYMVPSLLAVPGIVVLHDYCLQYLVLGLTLRKGDLRGLKQILEPSYGSRAKALARRLLFGTMDPLELSFARPFIEASKAVIVHSAYARKLIQADFPDKQVADIPMGVDDETGAPSEVLKKKYGFHEDDFVLVSATTSSYNKRLVLALAAMQALRPRFPQLKLVILGGGPLSPKEKKLMRHRLLREAVVRTGWLPSSTYRDYIHLADAVVDMRYPSGAETSASLVRAMAAGKPLVVSAQGPFLEIPDECCVKIPVDGQETENLAQTLASMIEKGERRLALGRASREYFNSRLQLRQAALSYVRFATQVTSGPSGPATSVTFSSHPSVWERQLVSSTYRLCRLTRLLRDYGVRATLKRIREELGHGGFRDEGSARAQSAFASKS